MNVLYFCHSHHSLRGLSLRNLSLKTRTVLVVFVFSITGGVNSVSGGVCSELSLSAFAVILSFYYFDCSVLSLLYLFPFWDNFWFLFSMQVSRRPPSLVCFASCWCLISCITFSNQGEVSFWFVCYYDGVGDGVACSCLINVRVSVIRLVRFRGLVSLFLNFSRFRFYNVMDYGIGGVLGWSAVVEGVGFCVVWFVKGWGFEQCV